MGVNEPSQGASICTVTETVQATRPTYTKIVTEDITVTLPGVLVDKTAAPRQRRGLAEPSEITPNCSATVTRTVTVTRVNVISVTRVVQNIVTVRSCVAGDRLVGKDCIPVKK